MNKTLMIAAALLTLGVGSAFADGDVTAQPAQVGKTAVSQQAASAQTTAYQASTQSRSVRIYSQFRAPGFTQGGEN